MGVEYWLVLLAIWVALVFAWSYRRRVTQRRNSPYKSELDRRWEETFGDSKGHGGKTR